MTQEEVVKEAISMALLIDYVMENMTEEELSEEIKFQIEQMKKQSLL